nr:hypothetical protein [Candidatus Enterousia merdequi]
MKKNTVLFCTGLSGSGKSYFIKNILPKGAFHNLKSATTRKMRDGEMDGREYYFREESYFDTEKLATKLWVNEHFWTPGQPKWLYGVPEFEIYDNMGANFTYDVIQPRYVRQLIDWFRMRNLDNKYDFRILWFTPSKNGSEIVKNRQNMPNDIDVRRTNTCDMQDFKNAKLYPNHIVTCNPQELTMDDNLRAFLHSLKTNSK